MALINRFLCIGTMSVTVPYYRVNGRLRGKTVYAGLCVREFEGLAAVEEKQRAQWQLLDDGQGIHSPDIDEDLTVCGMLKGA